MNTSWVRCYGCNKVFTPHGHSQHVSRTHRASCRTSGQPTRPQVVSRSLFQTDSRFCTEGSGAVDENPANQAHSDGLEPDDHEDTADQEDADALEALLQDSNPSRTIHSYLDPPDVVLSSAPAPESDSTVSVERSHSDRCEVF